MKLYLSRNLSPRVASRYDDEGSMTFPRPAHFTAALPRRPGASEGKQRTVDATIKAWRKRIYELIREMLVVERRRQLDDVERCTDTGVPGNFIETYSPILQWMRGPRLNSAGAACDEVITEFGGDARELASEILRLRTAMRQAANALTQARAQGYVFHPR
jgi:hypothetical protein